MNREVGNDVNGISPQGSLLVLDCWGCKFDLLNSPEFLLTHAILAAEMAGMHVLANLIIPFSPQGLTIVIVLSESHLTIHTTPEWGYAGIDIFTCGEGKPEAASAYLFEVLKPKNVISQRFQRGIIKSNTEIMAEGDERNHAGRQTDPVEEGYFARSR